MLKMLKIVKNPIFVFGSLFLVTMLISFFSPLTISSNGFLDDFIGSQLLSLLSVILTVTLASVANIHLTLSKKTNEITDHKKKAAAKKAAGEARVEINSNALGLFVTFLFALVLLIIDGHFILYDIYQSMFRLSGDDT